MWRDRPFHSKRLPGWARNVQLTLSAFSKWCNIITWGNVLSSKWDKFIFCGAAFVPSGREAIKLEGSVGSRARHMWRERGARRKRLGQRPNLCLCLLCGPSLGKQEAAILWNKFPLIWACWSGAPVGRLLSCALPACPTDQPSLPFTVPTHCKTDAMSAGGFRAVGISALPWTAHVCSQQAGALPWRKELSGEELARDWSAPPASLQPTPIQLVLLFKSSQTLEHECFVFFFCGRSE